MTGWRIWSVRGDQTYPFPGGYILEAGASVYVHSGREARDEPPTHLWWTARHVWNNEGDEAWLLDPQGNKIDDDWYGQRPPW